MIKPLQGHCSKVNEIKKVVFQNDLSLQKHFSGKEYTSAVHMPYVLSPVLFTWLFMWCGPSSQQGRRQNYIRDRPKFVYVFVFGVENDNLW